MIPKFAIILMIKKKITMNKFQKPTLLNNQKNYHNLSLSQNISRLHKS